MGENLSHRGKYLEYTGNFWQLSAQGQSEVIWCISDFRQPSILGTAGRRAKHENLGLGGKYLVYTRYSSQLSFQD